MTDVSKPEIPWTATSSAIDSVWSEAIGPEQVPDMLATLFAIQANTLGRMRLREVMNGSPDVPASEHGMVDRRNVQNRLHELYGHTIREFSEAMQHLKNKPWKMKLTPVDEPAFREEVTDTFLFFIEFCIVAGISAEDLFLSYLIKTNIVLTRAENGTH